MPAALNGKPAGGGGAAAAPGAQTPLDKRLGAL